jgi:hypothetical protein
MAVFSGAMAMPGWRGKALKNITKWQWLRTAAVHGHKAYSAWQKKLALSTYG